jgi:glycosyltransferase involved in cell wall biosynthesis
MNTGSIRVLVVGADRVVGGVPQYVQTLERFTNRQAVKFHVVVSAGKPESGAPRFETMIKHVCPLRYSLLSLPFRMLRLRRLLRRHRIDVLHLHTARAGLVGCLAATGTHVPVVYTGHGWRFAQKSNAFARAVFYALERYICKRASVATFLTAKDRDFGVRKRLVTPAGSVVIPTNIDAERFAAVTAVEVASERAALGIPPEASVIGTVGRLDEGKDPATFLSAGARVLARIPNAFVLWVGDGPLRPQAETLASRLGISGRFILTGRRPNDRIPALLKIMDVFLFPSHGETFSVALLEAEASQTPIVAASFPGVENVIQHNETGYVFPIGDADEAAKWVGLLLTDPKTRRRIVTAAYDQVIARHSQPCSMERRFEELYMRFSRRSPYAAEPESIEIRRAA